MSRRVLLSVLLLPLLVMCILLALLMSAGTASGQEPLSGQPGWVVDPRAPEEQVEQGECVGHINIESTNYSALYVTAGEWLTPTNAYILDFGSWNILSAPNVTWVYAFEIKDGGPWGLPIINWHDQTGVGASVFPIGPGWGMQPGRLYWVTFSYKAGPVGEQISCFATLPVVFQEHAVLLPFIHSS